MHILIYFCGAEHPDESQNLAHLKQFENGDVPNMGKQSLPDVSSIIQNPTQVQSMIQDNRNANSNRLLCSISFVPSTKSSMGIGSRFQG